MHYVCVYVDWDRPWWPDGRRPPARRLAERKRHRGVDALHHVRSSHVFITASHHLTHFMIQHFICLYGRNTEPRNYLVVLNVHPGLIFRRLPFPPTSHRRSNIKKSGTFDTMNVVFAFITSNLRTAATSSQLPTPARRSRRSRRRR